MSYNVCTGWTLFFVSALGLAGMSYLQIDLGTLFQFGLKTLLILGFLTFIIQYIVLPLLKRLKTKSTLRQDAQEPEPENVQKLKQARKTVQEKYSLEGIQYFDVLPIKTGIWQIPLAKGANDISPFATLDGLTLSG